MNLDIDKLVSLLKASTKSLLNNPNKYWPNVKFEANGRYLFVDNGANILAVAHLDTVNDMKNSWREKMKLKVDEEVVPVVTSVGEDDTEITSIALDDRLGVYFLMDLLPKYGMEMDILLTTDEEIGRSTAYDFVTNKEYNWMFQFDRHGYGTVVMYQYEENYLVKMMEEIGYDVQVGTFSDISVLDNLGCVGFNFGVGYINEHTNFCRTRQSWINVCFNMFIDFYLNYWDTKLPYEYIAPKVNKFGNYNNFHGTSVEYGPFSDDDYYYNRAKDSSSNQNKVTVYKSGFCEYCGTKLLQDEEKYCFDCEEIMIGEVKEIHKCGICDGIFSVDDLDDMGRCWDCIQDIKYSIENDKKDKL